ncbi:NAD(P)-dependent oxidoreductase [Achromobacter sp. LC458]|uniref:NAD(P)-dependent oxidoreductase n=1 Tax=Achromobacter spanius TaxID=217203 RepID=A0A2S5GRJ1_9BURK|nr:MULTISPECIES: NAD(P)-dependent oxidoreductase [Achromobacter]AYD65871.1 NAD(P)-dependent oxidoreductase [Achromobacter sp. B7]MDX3986009.1 NAD(P)-dependent oxidoreductase [Achromobacter sp.]PPA75463.1 NAD(P)-dependent oxidoreductase [Achromobacter spanius]TRM52349.1 NAD(P)-dependent oxidoreductase [Achromobacter sp. LC458]HCQ48095.1 NAD(P)-dependent oxidoreductase [Achromobacter sp.]
MSKTIYGFIGLGNMGNPLARRLIQAGHTLHVADTDSAVRQQLEALGAEGHDTPRAVGDAADVVFLSLPDGKVVDEVLGGERGLAAASRAKCVVDLSTVGPVAARRAYDTLAAQGIDYVDAPISGGPTGAERGTLAIMVACPPSRYDALGEVLSHFGKTFYLGAEAGQAQVMKLANNLLSATAVAITSEAMALGVKAGLDPSVMLDVINAGSGRNSATLEKFPRAVLTGTFNVGFAARLAHKDVRLCLEEAERHGVPMVVGSSVREMLVMTTAIHGRDADYADVARMVEDWAGVKIRARG